MHIPARIERIVRREALELVTIPKSTSDLDPHPPALIHLSLPVLFSFSGSFSGTHFALEFSLRSGAFRLAAGAWHGTVAWID